MAPSRFRAGRRINYALVLGLACVFGSRAQAVRHDSCADGIVSYPGGVNGQIRLCGALQQSDPKLVVQMEQMQKVIAGLGPQITRMFQVVNALATNLDPKRQAQMLESLVQKLGTTPESAEVRLNHLTPTLEKVSHDVQTMGADPASNAKLQQQMRGQLGDAIAQLDADEANADLADIRSELHVIDTTTRHTDTTVTKLDKTVEGYLHPERNMPTEEATIYRQFQPLMLEMSDLQRRWQRADLEAATVRTAASRPTYDPAAAAESRRQRDAQAIAPQLAEYQTLLPRLSAWHAQLVRRVPSLLQDPEFQTSTDQSSLEQNAQHAVRLGQAYSGGDSHPSPDLTREGHELQAALINLQFKIHQVIFQAMAHPAQGHTDAPKPPPRYVAPGTVYDDAVDGPFVEELNMMLAPRLVAWQVVAKKYSPEFRPTDFSGIRTSRDFSNAQSSFNAQAMIAYQHILSSAQSGASQ